MAKAKKAQPAYTMTLKDWYNVFEARTKVVGWSLFSENGIIAIQRIDTPSRGGKQLESDDEARELAVLGCTKNDVMCITALLLETGEVDAVINIPAVLNNNVDVLKIFQSIRTPQCCPYCASQGIHLTLVEWEANSTSDESHVETLLEHQCRACHKSFWT